MAGRSAGVQRRVYRRTWLDRIVAGLFFAFSVAVVLVLLFVHTGLHSVLPIALFFGAFGAIFLAVFLAVLASVTVASDAGVQNKWPDSPVFPWAAIESFDALRQKGRTDNWEVVLVPAENRRPIRLDGTVGPRRRAQATARELNALLEERRARG